MHIHIYVKIYVYSALDKSERLSRGALSLDLNPKYVCIYIYAYTYICEDICIFSPRQE